MADDAALGGCPGSPGRKSLKGLDPILSSGRSRRTELSNEIHIPTAIDWPDWWLSVFCHSDLRDGLNLKASHSPTPVESKACFLFLDLTGRPEPVTDPRSIRTTPERGPESETGQP